MTCEIVIECADCGKVIFGNHMYPDEVPDYMECPVCKQMSKVESKQLVNREVVITLINQGGKGYGTKKKPRTRIGTED